MTEVSVLPVLPTGQNASAWLPVEVDDVGYRVNIGGSGLSVTTGVLSVSGGGGGSITGVTAGTGLTGGGTSGTVTLSVSYGTSGTTAAAGNDSRITGALQAATAATTYATIPSFRTVSGTTDTPTGTDDKGFIAFTSASAVTITANDLGAGSSYSIQQQGAGRITVAAGAGVTLASDHGSPTYQTAAQWSLLTVICTGSGTVAVVGSML
jgi:hypothetical protein